MTDLLGAREIRELAESLGIRPTKKLGQNFVIDPNPVQRIVRAADVVPADRVLEVGPGLGSLTLALLQEVSSVIAIEIDPVLAEQLPRTIALHMPERTGSLTLIVSDAMKVDAVPGEPTALVANLPYNVSVPVLLHLLEVVPTIRTALVMVQKEVAERLAADPGSRTYGIPSLKARWYGEVRMAGNIGRNVFWPEPNVDSALVRVDRREQPTCESSREWVFKVIDTAFAQRRKSLRGALGALAGSPAAAEQALRAAGIDPGRRGEALTLPEFIALADSLHRASAR
ncbi:MAG: 16S rRNA (adenine(1518)-N(6)/adenine(1519)-N(6))-dimethyltransferase RsmA [Candidatus Nanopelagicales bacterium]